MFKELVIIALILQLQAVTSSKIPAPTYPNSKFLDPQLSEEENLNLLTTAEFVFENTTDGILVRKERNDEPSTSNNQPIPGGKKFGFVLPLLGMINIGSNMGNDYQNQYQVPGSTRPTSSYNVPFFNYPFYNYFNSRP